MGEEVSLEGGALGGLVATVGAGVRLLPSVCPHVHHHRGVPACAVRAEGAGMRLPPCVAVDVFLHGSLSCGLVRAVFAGKGLPIFHLRGVVGGGGGGGG